MVRQNVAGHPTYHVNVIKLKWEIIWKGGLPHLSGLPHLHEVPHLHVNGPLDIKHCCILILPVITSLYLAGFPSSLPFRTIQIFFLVKTFIFL